MINYAKTSTQKKRKRNISGDTEPSPVSTGVISTIAYVYDMAMNFKTYGGFTKDFAKASVVTSVMTVIGIGIGVGLSCLNLPIVVGVGIGIIVGLGLSYAEDAWKRDWIGY